MQATQHTCAQHLLLGKCNESFMLPHLGATSFCSYLWPLHLGW